MTSAVSTTARDRGRTWPALVLTATTALAAVGVVLVAGSTGAAATERSATGATTGPGSNPTAGPSGPQPSPLARACPDAGPASGGISRRTSISWQFDNRTPDGWCAIGAADSSAPRPWLAVEREAARSGSGGLLVGAVSGLGAGAGVAVTRATLAPGLYDVTAKIRVTPGHYSAPLGVDYPPDRTNYPTYLTDAAWTTVTGHFQVPADGTAGQLVIGQLSSRCGYTRSSPTTAFYLDEVSLTRSTVSPTGSGTGTPTPTAGGSNCPTPTLSPAPPSQVRVHYEVTRVTADGFDATLVITNLRDTPISPVTLYDGLRGGQQIRWVDGGRLDTSVSGSPKLIGTGPAAGIPVYGSVRISLGLTGSPVGTAEAFRPTIPYDIE